MKKKRMPCRCDHVFKFKQHSWTVRFIEIQIGAQENWKEIAKRWQSIGCKTPFACVWSARERVWRLSLFGVFLCVSVPFQLHFIFPYISVSTSTHSSWNEHSLKCVSVCVHVNNNYIHFFCFKINPSARVLTNGRLRSNQTDKIKFIISTTQKTIETNFHSFDEVDRMWQRCIAVVWQTGKHKHFIWIWASYTQRPSSITLCSKHFDARERENWNGVWMWIARERAKLLTNWTNQRTNERMVG